MSRFYIVKRRYLDQRVFVYICNSVDKCKGRCIVTDKHDTIYEPYVRLKLMCCWF